MSFLLFTYFPWSAGGTVIRTSAERSSELGCLRKGHPAAVWRCREARLRARVMGWCFVQVRIDGGFRWSRQRQVEETEGAELTRLNLGKLFTGLGIWEQLRVASCFLQKREGRKKHLQRKMLKVLKVSGVRFSREAASHGGVSGR